MKVIPFFIVFLLALPSLSAQTLSDRLSKDNEQILFSFLLKNKKIVSLCKDRQGNYLVYRFGTKDKVELEYPKKLDTSSWTAFKLYGVKRWGGAANAGFGDYSLSFINNGVTYEIFQNWNDEVNTSEIGITIVFGNKKTILKGSIQTKQGSLLRLDDEK
jgi:hypothetical protein